MTHPYYDPAVMTAFREWTANTLYVEPNLEEPTGDELEEAEPTEAPSEDQVRVSGMLTQALARLDGVVPGTEEFQYALEDVATALDQVLDDASITPEFREEVEVARDLVEQYQNIQWGFITDDAEKDPAEPMLDTMADSAGYLMSMHIEPDRASRRRARREVTRALTAAAGPLPKVARWRGVLGYEGQFTGDGRSIQHNALRWETPLPIRYVGVDNGGHDGAQVVGTVETIERREGGVIWGTGIFDLGSPHGQEAFRVVDNKIQRGVSLDLDDVSFEVRAAPKEKAVEQELSEDGSKTLMTVKPTDEQTITTDARVRAVTIVAIPAFATAQIETYTDEENVEGMAEADTFAVEEVYGVLVPELIIDRVLATLVTEGWDTAEEPEDGQAFRKNWVEKAGGLPPYIRRISKQLRKKGMAEGHAIATAVNVVKKMCATGDLNWKGKQNVNAKSRAEACAAVAQWEAMKLKSKVKNAGVTDRFAAKLRSETADKDGAAKKSTRSKSRSTAVKTEGKSVRVPTTRRAGQSGAFAYNPLQWRDPRNGQWIDMPGQFLGRFLDKLDDMFANSRLVPSYPESGATNKRYVDAMSRIREAAGLPPESFDPRDTRPFQMRVARLISDLYTAQDQLRDKNFKVVPQGFKGSEAELHGTAAKQATEAAYDLFDEVIADAEKFNKINWDKVLNDQELLDTGVGQWDDDADTTVPRIVPESFLNDGLGEDVSDLPVSSNVPRVSYPIEEAATRVMKIISELSDGNPDQVAIAGELDSALDGWEDPAVAPEVGADIRKIVESNSRAISGWEAFSPEVAKVLLDAADAIDGNPAKDPVAPVSYPLQDAVSSVQRVADSLLDSPRWQQRSLGEDLINSLDGWEDPDAALDVAQVLMQIARLEERKGDFAELTPAQRLVLENAARILSGGFDLTASAAQEGQEMTGGRNPFGQFGFDPDQLRWPKGTRRGGRWMPMPWKIGALFLGNDLEVKGWDGWRDSALGERGEIMRELDAKHVSNKGGLRDKVKSIDLEGVGAGGRKIIKTAAAMQVDLNELRADLETNDVDPGVLDLVDTALDDLDELLEVSEYDLDNIIEANRLEQETGIGGWGDEPEPRDPDLPPYRPEDEVDLPGWESTDEEVADMQEGRDMMRQGPQVNGVTIPRAGTDPSFDPNSNELWIRRPGDVEKALEAQGYVFDEVAEEWVVPESQNQSVSVPAPPLWRDDEFNATPVRLEDGGFGADQGWRTGRLAQGTPRKPPFNFLPSGALPAAVTPDKRIMVVETPGDRLGYRAKVFYWDDNSGNWVSDRSQIFRMRDLQKALKKHGVNMEADGTVGPFRGSEPAFAGESLQASAGKGTNMKAPSIELFKDPKLTGPTPLTLDEKTGRVYGHVATWDTCHIGNPEGPHRCTQPPRSKTGYAYFHVGSLVTAEGKEIAVGKLVQGTVHASTNADAMAALAHYENTGLAVADVRAGEDQYGIWVSGALRPSITPEQIREFRAAPLSGDWRRMRGNLEMIVGLAVNVPGFPIPRPAGMVASGRMMSLVASGMVPPKRIKKPGTEGALSDDDIRYLKSLANRERANHLAQLASKVEEAKRQVQLERIKKFAAQRKEL